MTECSHRFLIGDIGRPRIGTLADASGGGVNAHRWHNVCVIVSRWNHVSNYISICARDGQCALAFLLPMDSDCPVVKPDIIGDIN